MRLIWEDGIASPAAAASELQTNQDAPMSVFPLSLPPALAHAAPSVPEVRA